MESCATCGEPLDDDGLCGVCLFAGGLEREGLPAAIGPYRFVRLLGEGGMGMVYEAEQEQPHRTVALKVIDQVLLGASLAGQGKYQGAEPLL